MLTLGRVTHRFQSVMPTVPFKQINIHTVIEFFLFTNWKIISIERRALRPHKTNKERVLSKNIVPANALTKSATINE